MRVRVIIAAVRVSALVASLLATVVTAVPAPVTATTTASAYYVDSVLGSDSNAGTSRSTPWRTLGRLAPVTLRPGDRVLLARGSSWVGPLAVGAIGTRERPINVASYGTGALPVITGSTNCVTIAGSHVIVTEIEARSCSWAGIRISGGSNRVERSVITGNAAGIHVATGAVGNAIIDNDLVDNNRMSILTASPTNDDSGAFGILLNGDHTEIAHNRISGSDAFSHDYGRDGAAIEIYAAQHNSIHHNVATDNDAFTELGGSRSTGNVFAFNVVLSKLNTSVFVVTRGGDTSRGPVTGTELYRNTVRLSGGRSQGVVCYAGCSAAILKMRGNIVVAQSTTMYVDGTVDEDYDLFAGGGTVNVTAGPHTIFADPVFVDAAGGDLRLQATSPAVDRGTTAPFPTDAGGQSAAQDGNTDAGATPDIGAHERPVVTAVVTTTTSVAVSRGSITPAAETEPVAHGGDAADDPAIWIHPTDRSLSTIIGTNKQGALEVYDLAGRRLFRYADGELNNVDVRYNFPLGSERVDLVVASEQASDTLRIYRVDPATRGLVSVGSIPVGLGIAGLCLYHSPVSGDYYVFDSDSSGTVQQWRLFDAGSGAVSATEVRQFTLSSVTEGCVADDVHVALYVAEEDVALWRYGAEPDAGTARTRVDAVRSHLTPDIEGLTIYYRPDGTGYLVASSQGDDSFAVYERSAPNAFVTAFRIESGTVDGVTHTDGLDVTNAALGADFPGGVLVAQDDANDHSNQNFKLVPWERVAGGAPTVLAVDTDWDPRSIGR